MGRLTYGSGLWSTEIPDRPLAHLRIVILAKLRRSESFGFSWTTDTPGGRGRRVLWVHPTIPLQFEFHGRQPKTLNRAWIDALMDTANTQAGLRLMPEPESPAPARRPADRSPDLKNPMNDVEME